MSIINLCMKGLTTGTFHASSILHHQRLVITPVSLGLTCLAARPCPDVVRNELAGVDLFLIGVLCPPPGWRLSPRTLGVRMYS